MAGFDVDVAGTFDGSVDGVGAGAVERGNNCDLIKIFETYI